MTEQKLSDKFNSVVEHIRSKNVDEAKRLLVADPRLCKFEDDSGRLFVHWAASTGCLPLVKYAISENEELVTKADNSGWTLLMITSSAGHLEVVKYLLSFPLTDVNHRNLNGQIPLHYACSKNHYEIAKLLIDNGSELNAQDRFGASPLHRAAAQEDHDKIVQLLLSSNGIQVNIPDREGNTPLHCACEDGNESVALYLVRKGGADITLQNKEEKTPVDLAKGAEFKRKLQAAVNS